MWHNVSTNPPDSSSNANKLIRWRCFGNDEDTVSLSHGFMINVYLVAFVNAFCAIFALVTNSLVIYGVYRNKFLGKVTKTLTMLLALEGFFSASVIQSLFVTSKFIILANIQSPAQLSYCVCVIIIAYGTKIFAGLSIVTMLGITAERYVAVIYPMKYSNSKHTFLKALLIGQVILPIHFILSDIWIWYKTISRILTFLFTLIPYIFTVYAYGKIYLKLWRLQKAWENCTEGTVTIAPKRKNQSLASFLVVGAYLVCYLPLVLIRGLSLDKKHLNVQLYLRPWFNTLLFCSFSVNALVYGWRSARIIKVVGERLGALKQ